VPWACASVALACCLLQLTSVTPDSQGALVNVHWPQVSRGVWVLCSPWTLALTWRPWGPLGGRC
jgi:hypothetical protein